MTKYDYNKFHQKGSLTADDICTALDFILRKQLMESDSEQ